MESNRTFLAIIVLMLSAQSFASAPYYAEPFDKSSGVNALRIGSGACPEQSEGKDRPAEQIEGQPGAMPPRVYDPARYCASASSSSASGVPIYKDQGTQTDISGTDNEQVIARVSIILKNSNKLVVKSTEKALSEIAQKAQSGSMIHARAVAKFKWLLESNASLSESDKNCNILLDAQLIEKKNKYTMHQLDEYVVNEDVREAYVAEGLIESVSDLE